MTSLRNRIYFLVSLCLGLGLGIFSAQYAIQKGGAAPGMTFGPWQSFTQTSINEVNPYALAYTSLYGNLKLPRFEALYFSALRDDEGRGLAGKCQYEISGTSPGSKWWSLTIYDQHGRLIDNPAERYSFNNTNLVYKNDKSFTIVLSPSARAGNWIPTPTGQPFIVMLRMYAPANRSLNDTKNIAFPEIKRVGC